MAIYLLTVERAERTEQGQRLVPVSAPARPGIDRPSARCVRARAWELRRPDGVRRLTHLVTYGISVWRGEDGSLYTNEDPSDPEIKLTLPDDLSPEDMAAGTEVWLLEAHDG